MGELTIIVNRDSVHFHNDKFFDELREAALGNISPFSLHQIIDLCTITSKKKFKKKFKQYLKEYGC